MKRLIKLGSKGDTIIEVLLSIAVMSMVLSISYGLANRSSQTNRQSQERAEAQKIGEEQLELLRGYINEDTQWDNATDVCFRADDPATTTVDETGQITDQTSDCQGRGPGGRYNVKITVAGNPAEGYVYTIDTNWQNIRGGTDLLALSYKLASTGDIPRTPHFACSDGVNNNDNDSLIDFPADPDCTGPTGNSEDPPPPPPDVCSNIPGNQLTPPTGHTQAADGTCYRNPFYIHLYGRDFSQCTAIGIGGDAFDGCKTSSTPDADSINQPDEWYQTNSGLSVYAYRDVGLRYSIPSSGSIGSGAANIEIRYRQARTWASGAPAGYNFQLVANAGAGNSTYSLAAGAENEGRIFRGSINVGDNPSNLNVTWNNNAGVDPNLQIDSIMVCSPTANPASDGCSSSLLPGIRLPSLGWGWTSTNPCSLSDYLGGGAASCYTNGLYADGTTKYGPFQPVWSYIPQDLIYSASGLVDGKEHEIEITYRNHRNSVQNQSVLPSWYNRFNIGYCFNRIPLNTAADQDCANTDLPIDPNDPMKKQTKTIRLTKNSGKNYFRIIWPAGNTNTNGYDASGPSHDANIEIDSVRVIN